MGFHREVLLAPRPTPKMEDHPLSAVSDCLFNLFAKDNIEMDLQDVEGGCGNWMELAQDREKWRALVSTVIKFRVS